MSKSTITERQQHWLDFAQAGTAFEVNIVEYAAANKLKTNDINLWKTLLIKRGLLPITAAESTDFWL
jgi:hypothetical protein